ncbi:MAG: adenylyl-sulfate kinase [Gallionellaceae bacterium]|nr:adenylyl-sulfate kinase [Gallionellaceae bacterium]
MFVGHGRTCHVLDVLDGDNVRHGLNRNLGVFP